MQSVVTNNPAEDVLALVDNLSRGFIDSVTEIRFNTAQNDMEREEVYRLRYRVVVERGWVTSNEFPDGMERDHYDTNAIHITGWDGNVLAATSRLVLPRSGEVLPTEEAFNIQI